MNEGRKEAYQDMITGREELEEWPSNEVLTQQLIDLLSVQSTGETLFRGSRKIGGVGRVYGGQVVAQALVAAMRTVDDARVAHSLHAYFLRGGSEDHEIDFQVEADFDGGSFCNRRVVAMQQGQVILNLAASFQKSEPGHFHQPPMPDVPTPEELESTYTMARKAAAIEGARVPAFFLRPWPIEIRPVGEPPFSEKASRDPHSAMWFKVVGAVEGQPQSMHRAIVAYGSDIALIATAMQPHMPFKVQAASLDHSVWFHQDARADDWLLYTIDSPWAGQGRGLGIGKIFNREGRLVATVAQEGLMRDLGMRGK